MMNLVECNNIILIVKLIVNILEDIKKVKNNLIQKKNMMKQNINKIILIKIYSNLKLLKKRKMLNKKGL